MYTFKQFLLSEEKKDKTKKKKPTDNQKNEKKFGIANKEAIHGGMSYYSSGEL